MHGKGKISLSIQKKKKKVNQLVQCLHCEYKTSYSGNLRAHVKRTHTENVVDFKCNQCEFATKYKQALKFHIDSKHSVYTYPCTICKYSTKALHLLKQHMRKKHYERRNSL